MSTFTLERNNLTLEVTDDKAILGTIEDGKIVPHRMVGELLSFVELGVQLLACPEVEQIAPQLYLPWLEIVPRVKGSDLREVIGEHQKAYRDSFGEPDPLGMPTILRALIDEKEILSWGDVQLYRGKHNGLPKPRSQKSFTILAPGPVSVELVLDLLAGFLYDIRLQSDSDCSRYSVRYLRRWGQDAFEGYQLRSDVPAILTKGVTLTEDDEDDDDPFDFGSSSDSISTIADPLQGLATSSVDQGELNVLRERLQQVEELLTAARSENESLKRAAKRRPEPAVDAEPSVSKAEIQELEARIEGLELDKIQLKNVLADAKGRHGSFESRIKEAQAQLERTQGELRDATVEISKEHSRAEKLLAECEELRPLKEEVETLEGQVRSLTKDIALLHEKADDVPKAEEALERLRLAKIAVADGQQTFCDIAALPLDKLGPRVRDLAGRKARSKKHRKRLAGLVS